MDDLPVTVEQQSLKRRRQPARYSTRPAHRTGSASALSDPNVGQSTRSSSFSVNQWTLLVCAGMVLFIVVTLSAGVIVGRALRGPIAGSRPANSLTVVGSQTLAQSGARINPRLVSNGSAGLREGRVSLLWDQPLAAGDGAPNFQLEALNGDPLVLSQLRGQIVVINFWATWCAWCKYELPALQAVHEKYRDRGMVVVGVDVEEPRSLVDAYVQRYSLSFPVVLDISGSATDMYQVRGLPTTYFVDRAGTIIHVQRGAMREDELERYVLAVLEAK